MPPSLSAYDNQVNKFQQTRELLQELDNIPVAVPCFTLFPRSCRNGSKFLAFAYPAGRLQYIGLWDNLNDLHECLALFHTYPGAVCECRWPVRGGDNVVDNIPRGKLFFKFRIPDYRKLALVRRPGTTLPYVW